MGAERAGWVVQAPGWVRAAVWMPKPSIAPLDVLLHVRSLRCMTSQPCEHGAGCGSGPRLIFLHRGPFEPTPLSCLLPSRLQARLESAQEWEAAGGGPYEAEGDRRHRSPICEAMLGRACSLRTRTHVYACPLTCV